MSSGIQHKMLGYEVAPPPGVWNKIAAELDESELAHVFPSKLYEAEVAAPAGTWNTIEAALDAENEVFAPKRRTMSPWLRYAAAAVLIGFVAWGGIQLLNNSKNSENPLASGDKQSAEQDRSTTTAVNSIESEPGINTDRTDEARNDIALEESKKTYAKLDMSARTTRLKNIASAYRFASNSELTGPDEFNTVEREGTDLNDRYIVLMTPDGHFVRMSKKLSDMVCCISGEEQDKECVDQMSNWKTRMACSPTGHSTGSFLDILSLIKSLEDK